MFLTRSEYDRGVNTFSPEGRLFQVEYAIEVRARTARHCRTCDTMHPPPLSRPPSQAIKIGTTAIGIATTEGVVIAVEKRLLSPLQEPSSVEKLFEVDSHVGARAGWGGAGVRRSLLSRKRQGEVRMHDSFSFSALDRQGENW
eukprot:scaffold9719_cov116-Isochrysis_galbana.AAC.1